MIVAMESLFFWISKIAWLIIAPDNFLILCLLLGAVCLVLNKTFFAKFFLLPSIFVMALIAICPVGEWLLHPLEMRFATNPRLPDRIDGIIVLGGAERSVLAKKWRQVELNWAAERQTAFISLARRYPNAKLIYTGGSGSLVYQEFKGADVAEGLYTELGLDRNRITIERNSRNTFENAVNSKKLIQPGMNENWVLITTAWHMPRSVGIFCRVNWSVIPYPVDHWTWPENRLFSGLEFYDNITALHIGVKEWVGLMVYYLTNKTDRLFPRGC